MELKTNELTNAVLSCLFAALISIGAFIALPVPGSPVPIVLQNMFIMLTALIMGPWWGAFATALYLLFGFLGLPVFSGGAGGIAKLLGPTGGYLFGYLPASIAMGFIARKGKHTIFINICACLAGMAIVYIFGIARLRAVLDVDWGKALAVGLYPFILGDAVKIVLASLLAPRLFAGMETLTGRDGDV
ncbi:MAG TPA: biotin transporter BioY [Rectinemataceae bacterium]|nr:biotin transporter BioY [Rectinemataceae bacterium]